MATPVKRIEKEFLLKTLYDDKIPVMHIKGKSYYALTVEKSGKGQMVFKSDKPIEGLKVNKTIDLIFDYRGQMIIFSVVVENYKNCQIITSEPEFLYKNLDRSFTRVSTPPDLQVQFSFLGDRYSLSYPKVLDFEGDDQTEPEGNMDPQDISGLTDGIVTWIKGYATGHKLVLFRGVKPSSTEERLLAETGKALFLPSTQGRFPANDPSPKKRLITEDIFMRFLESTGIGRKFLDAACARFIEQKLNAGLLSDLWVPLLFQEYVIGYIHIWIDNEELPPFGYEVIENMFQLAKILTYSLKVNGYFEAGKLKNETLEGKIIDISASGLLFAYPNSALASALIPDTEISVKLIAGHRKVKTKAKIMRRYNDKNQVYFGCRFFEMEPKDLSFLFEYIYGKTFSDADASFLVGNV